MCDLTSGDLQLELTSATLYEKGKEGSKHYNLVSKYVNINKQYIIILSTKSQYVPGILPSQTHILSLLQSKTGSK